MRLFIIKVPSLHALCLRIFGFDGVFSYPLFTFLPLIFVLRETELSKRQWLFLDYFVGPGTIAILYL